MNEKERAVNEALSELIGHQVDVRSRVWNGEASDEGILEAYDYPWIRLRKGKDELLCFPVHNIRFVKMLKRFAPPGPGDILLRPSDPPK